LKAEEKEKEEDTPRAPAPPLPPSFSLFPLFVLASPEERRQKLKKQREGDDPKEYTVCGSVICA